MKKIINLTIFLTLSCFVSESVFADSKIANKVWGDKDCSAYSTKTFSG